MGIRFCSPAEIREYNARYRGRDEVTDVLSFSAREGAPEDGEIEGDLLLCLEDIVDSAREWGVAAGEELLRVTLHGLLHLMGHDHEDDSPTQPMLRLQEELLREYLRGSGEGSLGQSVGLSP